MRSRQIIIVVIGVVVVVLVALAATNFFQNETPPVAITQATTESESPRAIDLAPAAVSPPSPLSSPLPTPSDISALLDTADQQFEGGQYEEAFANYSQAVQIGQGNILWRAHAGRGNVYSAWRRQPEALAEYNTALNYARTPVTLISRCNVHRLMHNYDQAIADCSEAASLDPEDAEVPLVLASLFLDQGELEKARQEVEQAQHLDPALAQAFYLLSLIDLAEGNGQKSVDNLTKAIELMPDSAFFYWERGFLYLGLGQIENARADMEKVLEVGDPLNDGDVMLKAGTQLQFLEGATDPED
jgi:tetratricopeptide (TPR) repeat protein